MGDAHTIMGDTHTIVNDTHIVVRWTAADLRQLIYESGTLLRNERGCRTFLQHDCECGFLWQPIRICTNMMISAVVFYRQIFNLLSSINNSDPSPFGNVFLGGVSRSEHKGTNVDVQKIGELTSFSRCCPKHIARLTGSQKLSAREEIACRGLKYPHERWIRIVGS